MDKEELQVKSIAARLGFSRQTVYNWIYSGDLKAVKVGPRKNARVRIDEKSLKNFLRDAKRK